MRKFILIAFLSTPTMVFAQGADPAQLQRLVTVLQTQRNQILDNLTVTQADNARLTEELNKAKEEIKRLKPAKDAK